MPDRAIDVAPTGSSPWSGMTSCFRFGDLSSVLDLSGEHGFAAGPDLDDETQPNIVGTDSRVRIQFRGEGEGCLTFDPNAETGIHAPSNNSLDFTVRGSAVLRLDSDEGLIVWDIGGNPILNVARHGNVDVGADIHARGRLGLSAQDSVVVLLDTQNAHNDMEFIVSTNSIGYGGSQALFYVDERIKTGMRHPSVQHYGTSIAAHTDTFMEITYDDGAAGGAVISGLKDQSVAAGSEGGCLILSGYLADDDADTGKGVSDRALVEVRGAQLSSGSLADVGANGNVFAVIVRRGSAWETVYIIDEDGDVARDGGISTYDALDDAAIVSDLYRVLCDEEPDVYNEEYLVNLGVLSQGSGRHMVSEKKLMALTMGSIRQTRHRQDKALGTLNSVLSRLGALEEKVGI